MLPVQFNGITARPIHIPRCIQTVYQKLCLQQLCMFIYSRRIGSCNLRTAKNAVAAHRLLFLSENYNQLQFLQQHFPIIMGMLKETCQDGLIPHHVLAIVYDLVEKGKLSFNVPNTSRGSYPDPCTKNCLTVWIFSWPAIIAWVSKNLLIEQSWLFSVVSSWQWNYLHLRVVYTVVCTCLHIFVCWVFY